MKIKLNVWLYSIACYFFFCSAFAHATAPEVMSITLNNSQVEESDDVMMTVQLSEFTNQPFEYYFTLNTQENDSTLSAKFNDFQTIMMFSYTRPVFNVLPNEWQAVINLKTSNKWSVPAGVDRFNIRFLARQNFDAEDLDEETASFTVSTSADPADGQTASFSILNREQRRLCAATNPSYMLPSSYPTDEGEIVFVNSGLNQSLVCQRNFNLQLVEGSNFYPNEAAAEASVDYSTDATLTYFWYNAATQSVETTVLNNIDLSSPYTVSLPRGTYEYQVAVQTLTDSEDDEGLEYFNLYAWFEDDVDQDYLSIRDLRIAQPIITTPRIVSVAVTPETVTEGESAVGVIRVDHGSPVEAMRIGIAVEDNSVPGTNLSGSPSDYNQVIQVSTDNVNFTDFTLNNSNFINYTVPADIDEVYVRVMTVSDTEEEGDETIAVSAWFIAETESSYQFGSLTIQDPSQSVVATDDAVTVNEDDSINIDVLANDTGDDISILSITGAANGTVSVINGVVSYAPNQNFNGTDSFTYTITDPQGNQDTATVSITISAVNDAPVAENDVAQTNEDQSVTIPVLVNDSDPDGDNLIVEGASANNGTVSIQNGQLQYSPDSNFNGSDLISYQVSDSNGGTASATVSVTVLPINDAPVANNDTALTNEDVATTINVLSNDVDVDGDSLTVQSATVPATQGTVTVNGDGTLSFTPASNFNGSATISYVVSDGSLSDSGTVTVTITSQNDAPVANDDNAQTAEDQAVSIDVLANDSDPDGDSLSISAVTANNGQVSVVNGQVQYTPNADFNGTDTISYSISDPFGGTASAEVTVTISAVNDAPSGNDDSAQTSEDTAVTVDVLANDTDVEGSDLSVESASVPSSQGTVTVNPDGTLTFTPAANFNGTATISYWVTDGELSSEATLTVEVSSENDVPVAVNDFASVEEDGSVTVDALSNDSDADGDSLTLDSASANNGTVSLVNNELYYTPNANFNGTDTITYQVSDGQGGTASATVTVTVTAVNDAPTINDDVASTNEDTATTINVLANDIDVDGDNLTVQSATVDASQGTVTVNQDGTLTFTPAANFNGTAIISYTATDGTLTGTGTVTVTISNENDSPEANDDSASTQEDEQATIDVLANDSDPDGDSLSITSANASQGTVTINNGQLVYTPNANFNGTDSITYVVSDGNNGTDSATVTVTVTAVNDAPTINDDVASTNEDSATTINVLANDTDVDGDNLTVQSATVDASQGTVTVNQDGTLTFTPAANFNGTATISYTATDGTLTGTGTVTVTVSNENDAPSAENDTASTDEDQAVSIDVLANDSDPDGDSLSISSVTTNNGTATVSNGEVVFTPAANFNGTATLSYVVTDGNNGTASATVTVSVAAVNDAPNAVNDTASTNEDSAATINVLANDTDVDGDNLTIASASVPATQGTVTVNADQTLTFTPAPNFSGTAVISYTATDGTLTSSAAVSVTVNAQNDAPNAVNDSGSMNEDSTRSFNVLGNDTDADGDSLTINQLSNVSNGTASIVNNQIRFVPRANFSGTAAVTYRVTDGNGGSDTARLTITVNAVNDAPNAVNDSGNMNEDSTRSFNVLGNDTDADGDSLTINQLSNVSNGTASIVNNQIRFVPRANFSGTAAVTYRVTDGNGGSDTARLTITVNAVNDAPNAVNDTGSMNEDSTRSFNVLGNDTDADGDSLTINQLSNVSNGTASIVNNQIRFVPRANFSGTAAVTYRVTDGNGGSDTARLTITVNAVNDAPNAVNDTASTNEGQAITINVLANDTDPEGDTLRVTQASAQRGSVTINSNQRIRYVPNALFSGTDTLTYTISDGNGGTDSATVRVTVASATAEISLITVKDTTGEGNRVRYTIKLNRAISVPAQITVTTQAITATKGVDYTFADTVLTIAPGSTERTFQIDTVDDNLFEPQERFRVRISANTNTTGSASALAYINDNDPAPSISLIAVKNTATEGNRTRFTVKLSQAITQEAKVNVRAESVTATKGQDFTFPDTVVTFDAGQTEKTIQVTTIDDSTHEPRESFRLRATPHTNTSGSAAILGYIDDNDPLPSCMNVQNNRVKFAAGTIVRVEDRRNALDNQRYKLLRNGSAISGYRFPVQGQWNNRGNVNGGNDWYSLFYQYDKSNNGWWSNGSCRTEVINSKKVRFGCEDTFDNDYNDTQVTFTITNASGICQ